MNFPVSESKRPKESRVALTGQRRTEQETHILLIREKQNALKSGMKGILTIEDGLQTTEIGRLQAESRRLDRNDRPLDLHPFEFEIQIRDFGIEIPNVFLRFSSLAP